MKYLLDFVISHDPCNSYNLINKNLINKNIFQKNIIHKSAVIHPSVKLGKNIIIESCVHIGKNTVINSNTIIKHGVYIGDNIEIGENCLLNSNCVIKNSCILKNRVIIHAGAIIGEEGFTYTNQRDTFLDIAQNSPSRLFRDKNNILSQSEKDSFLNNPHLKLHSIGGVILEDDVEIGANSCVDRGTLGNTIIKRGTKIDNQVQIGHNCQIGEDCVIVAGTGIAGSVKTGDRCFFGGNTGFKQGISVGNDNLVLATSHLHTDSEDFAILAGSPAVSVNEYIKKEKEAKQFKKELAELKSELESLKKAVLDIIPDRNS